MSPVSNTSARRGTGRNRTSETLLRRPTSKPCHHGLSRPKTWLPLSLGPKSAQKAWKSEALRSKSFSPPKSEIQPRSTPKFGLGPGAGLVRAWCGPGAGLVRAWQSCVGHRIAASILRWQQDCPNHSCATHRIALMRYQQLGLGAVLARAQPCEASGTSLMLSREAIAQQDVQAGGAASLSGRRRLK